MAVFWDNLRPISEDNYRLLVGLGFELRRVPMDGILGAPDTSPPSPIGAVLNDFQRRRRQVVDMLRLGVCDSAALARASGLDLRETSTIKFQETKARRRTLAPAAQDGAPTKRRASFDPSKDRAPR